MSEKRRDKKGRILRIGESQRSDGRYSYGYTDAVGGRHFVYSWKLEPHDKIPNGKRDCESLREKEREIDEKLEAGILASSIKVYPLVRQSIETNMKIAKQTKEQYLLEIDRNLKNTPLGKMRIDKVKYPHIKQWLISLNQKGISGQSLNVVFCPVRTAFKEAEDSNLILKSPASFKLTDVISMNKKQVDALPLEMMNDFLHTLYYNGYFSYYYNAFYILFHTGLRISELSGLTASDIDFDKKILNVDHQLIALANGSMTISKPKTRTGIRKIPLGDKTLECFSRELEKPRPKIEPEIDGYSDFIFLTRRTHKPTYRGIWSTVFNGAWKMFSRSHDVGKFTHFSPHVCRHTYCTNLIKAGINVKTVQYLMGHKKVSTTLGIYTSVNSSAEIRDELAKVFTTDFTTNDA